MPPLKPNTYSYITGQIIKETAAAILFKHAGVSHWFPLSQVKEIHRDIELEDGDYADQIQVADWILEKKGIEL